MTLNCASLSAAAKRHAAAHGDCAAGPTARPDTTVSGDCGESWLYMGNAGNGDAQFYYGFQSTLGNVVYRALNVTWLNWNDNYSDGLYDFGGMNDSFYANSRAEFAGAGFVTGVMSGEVLLWWGGICTIDYPSAYTTVT
jgi:hypothetical protein